MAESNNSEVEIEKLKAELLLKKLEVTKLENELDMAEDYIADLEEMLMSFGNSDFIEEDDDEDDEED